MNLSVVLVSDQTIPNVVYLKNIEKKWDKVLLISTKNMEAPKKNKSKAILSAIGKVDYDVLVVDENMLFDIREKLKNYFEGKRFDKIFVNITGGTKIMSLATYNFFKDKSFTENIVYLPIGSTSYKQIYPLGDDDKAIDLPITYKMDVEGYLKALGVGIESIGKPVNPRLSKKLFGLFFDKRWIFFELTTILRNYRNSDGPKKLLKPSSLNDFNKVLGFLQLLGLNEKEFDFSKDRTWIDYFSGGWFEEYVYSELEKLKGICIDDIKINIKLERKFGDAKMPNEFDVIFIVSNSLNIIECKSGDLSGFELSNTFYKVAYLNRIFGLSAKSYLVSLGENIFDNKTGKLKPSIDSKSKVFGVSFVSYKNVKDGIDNYFKQKLLCK